MKFRKYNECSPELSTVENGVVIESKNDEEHIKLAAINFMLSSDSCNSDLKELLKSNNDRVQIKKYYIPVYSIKCMVNDDYRVSYSESGSTTVHVVCGENETRLDEEVFENVRKEDVVRFEGDYNFCCSEYKGIFSDKFIHLELENYSTKNADFDSLDIVDKFISSKTLQKLIDDKVKQAFANFGTSQAKKYILSKHEEATFISCEQSTKIIDSKKTIYLVPVFEVTATYNEEEYVSYVSGIENFAEYDYPRSAEFIKFNSLTRRNYFLNYILFNVFLLLSSGLLGALCYFLRNTFSAFTKTYFLICVVLISVIAIALLVLYNLKHKKYKKIKNQVITKYDNATKKSNSLFFNRLVTLVVCNIICIVGIILFLVL